MAELAWSAGCQFAHVPELGGWAPIHNERMETTLQDIYVVGDVCGIGEASTAMEEGQISGIAAAESLGYLKRGKTEELLEEKRKRLDTLRGGPFATHTKAGKGKLMKRYYKS